MNLPESRRTYTGLFVLPHSCIPIVNGNSLDRNHDKIYNFAKAKQKAHFILHHKHHKHHGNIVFLFL